MNLQQAITMSKMKEQRPSLGVKRKQLSALTLAKERVLLAEAEGRTFDGHSVNEVADLLFASKTFVLMEVPLNKIASPGRRSDNVALMRRIMAEGVHSTPIVVDLNVHKAGKSAKTGYYPPVIVVDGKERFEAAANNAEEKIQAWVGNLAAERMTIHADHQIGTEELQGLLYEAIKDDLGLNDKNNYDAGVYIQNCYPLENYCIYKYKGESFRQKYVVDMDEREVTLVGPPKAVVQKWQDKELKARGTLESAINACACQETKASADVAYASKDGKPIILKRMLVMYNAAVKSGKFKVTKDMEAKSAPGWEGTIKEMKKHPEIDNPYALTWWMDEQGYESHK